jgi:alpha-galactosidase
MHITVLGAGSMFTPRLVNDILKIPGDIGGEICLVDIDRTRLSTMDRLIKKLILTAGKPGWRVKSTTRRRKVLRGTDYLVNCIEVSGLACVRFDNDIPAKFGVDQCIGDTIGPGGLFKGLRTIPVWLDILRDAEELCPDALVLNYTNPMNMMCLAAGRGSRMNVVGLCHSVQGTSRVLAQRAGIPYDELEFDCAGINHLSWFTTLRHHGQDLYPLLKKKAIKDLAGKPEDPQDAKDLVRKDVMLQFGAFVTESSGHLSEYLPFYRKRKDLRERYCRDGYDGGSGFYAREWPGWRKDADAERKGMLEGTVSMNWERSPEYASWIIESREKNIPGRIYGNVMNTTPGGGTLIGNLPADGCVEVACMVDRRGVRPVRFGALPPQMAALCDANMRMFDLAVAAALQRSKEAAVHALLLDPLTAAVCSPQEIRTMTLELFGAEKDFLRGYQ